MALSQTADASREALLNATRTLAAKRWRVAAVLTLCMVVVYFGFIALVAYDAALLATLLHEGLSLGILLGALVICAAWALTFIYISWTNRVYDPALSALRSQQSAHDALPGADR
jgi:uncharacterized membrane protein (DUF485 family)